MIRKTTLAMAFAASLMATAASAGTITVREFLTVAARIPHNPTALFRSDARRLMREFQGAVSTVQDEQKAARETGRGSGTCLPEKLSFSADDILRRFNAIPAARRDISLTQAMREWMAERYPCPAA